MNNDSISTKKNYIEHLTDLTSSLLLPEHFQVGLDPEQTELLLTFYSSIAGRFGSKSASRSVAKIGGVLALQTLLKALHKKKLATAKQRKLFEDIDEMLANSQNVDRIRMPPKTTSED